MGIDSFPGSPPPEGLLAPEEVQYVTARLGRYVDLVGQAYRSKDPEKYHSAQIIVKDFAWNLGFNELGPSILSEYSDRNELPGIALGAIPIILHSPRMDHANKVSLVSQYPSLLVHAGLTYTRFGAETSVRDYLTQNYVDYFELFKPRSRLSENARLYSEVSAQWRRQRWQRIGGFLKGLLARDTQ